MAGEGEGAAPGRETRRDHRKLWRVIAQDNARRQGGRVRITFGGIMPHYPMVKTVGIICKHDSQEAWQGAGKLIEWLQGREVAPVIDQGAARYLQVEGTPKGEIPDKADIVAV